MYPVMRRVATYSRPSPICMNPHLVKVAVRNDIVVSTILYMHKPVKVIEVNSLDCYVRPSVKQNTIRSVLDGHNIQAVGPVRYAIG